MPAWDFHLHTLASPDGHHSAADMATAALAQGLTHIAITDHYEADPYDQSLYPDDAPGWKEAAADRYHTVIARSWEGTEAAQRAFAGRLSIAHGLELGSPLSDVARTEEILATYSFDFLLASQHANPGLPDFYYLDYRKQDIGALLDTYFDALLAIVRWGKFQSLAHLTYPLRYIPADIRPADTRRWQDRIDLLLRELAQRGLALEINTSGLRKAIRQTSPDLPLIRRFKELGGEFITVGSDAHVAPDVGAGIPEALQLAAEAGFAYVTRYEQQQPIPVRIR